MFLRWIQCETWRTEFTSCSKVIFNFLDTLSRKMKIVRRLTNSMRNNTPCWWRWFLGRDTGAQCRRRDWKGTRLSSLDPSKLSAMLKKHSLFPITSQCPGTSQYHKALSKINNHTFKIRKHLSHNMMGTLRNYSLLNALHRFGRYPSAPRVGENVVEPCGTTSVVFVHVVWGHAAKSVF